MQNVQKPLLFGFIATISTSINTKYDKLASVLGTPVKRRGQCEHYKMLTFYLGISSKTSKKKECFYL